MSRLIDADEFQKQIVGMAILNNYPPDKANALCKLVDSQPTAFDVEQHGEKLMEIYKLFKIDGSLKRNLTAKEMVVVYHIADVLRGGRNEE